MRTNMSRTVEAFQEALQNYLPDIQLTSSRSIYGGDEPFSATVDFRFASGIMTNGAHGFSQDTLLIHYTSLQVLFEMVKAARFRLYGADKLNDPMELIHIMEDIPELSLEELHEERSNLYVGSFCAYTENDESFPMWRLYGQNGSGVAIVFKLVNDNSENWLDYSLGKVAYKKGVETISHLKEIFDLARAFQQKSPYKIENIPSALYAYALLNKTGIWEVEQEIRLMHYKRMDRLQWLYDDPQKIEEGTRIYPSVTTNGSIRYFTELRLDLELYRNELKKIHVHKEDQKLAFNLYPALKVEKVILGYNFSNEVIHDVAVNIEKLAKATLGYVFPVQGSKLARYFNHSK